jgi:hypothetical protein
MVLTRAGSLWVTLLFALALAALHLWAPRIRAFLPIPTQAASSFGGGVAAAYVFLYLLPRLAEGNQAVARALQERVESSALSSLGLFFVALLGFFVFYVLERVTHTAEPGRREASRFVFVAHLSFFALYSALVAYTLATKLRAGLIPGVLFAVAMGLHLLATDHVLADHFPTRLTTGARLVLVVGPLTGWAAAVVAQPTSTLLVSVLTAFLGGAVLLNVFNDELPPERHASFAWFTIGLAAYTVLITATTFAAKAGAA